MNTLYLYINLFSIIVPFAVSFHPKIRLHKYWGALFLAVLISMIPFIIWDVWFTLSGYWGFNTVYITGFHILGLPIEEWLFFICIPYSCVFTHLSMTILFPRLKLSLKFVKLLTVILLFLMAFFAVSHYGKWYTFVNFSYGFVFLFYVFKKDIALLQTYFWTFLIILIPFFIVNGILTGSWITDEVVWYNNNENLGFRLGTIPVEDTVYAFTLILSNLYFFRLFKKKSFVLRSF